ncbi:long-chain-fatty-acid--CoA ligase [Pseudonocardia abyssalis]|uniref:Long-chain-fatty-acid--CoA ligase n=2 Tax=Pseudonocardia abyssalis TaxID=2792008 RepID=A0ABS6UQ96_9PSEU|nr:long-chain-fatty-acid--CoA ligase [Pseudonocardia abyssalis]MBW0134422.1 long-chain-fatty-acid--CoA ligase [Pseudonocardia abyssalis]
MYLTQALHRCARQTPDTPATIFADRVRTWAQSADRVARLAAALRGAGVGVGDRVAMLALNSDRYHEYLFAVPWAGGVVTPMNIRWNPAEIAYALGDSGSTVLFVDDAFAPMLPTLRSLCPGLTTVVHCGDGPAPEGSLPYEGLVAGHDPAPDAHRSGDDLAGIFYTGGTTAHPKGVMLSHANLLVSAMGGGATGGGFVVPDGRFLHAAPMFHLAAIATWVGRGIVGGTHVIVPMFEPAAVARAIERHAVTEVLLVPTMIQMLVAHLENEPAELSGVRSLIYGASPISEALLVRAEKHFPTAGFTQAYGMTELSPIATLLTPADHADPVLRRSAGRAAVCAEVRIVDPGDGEVPSGTVGEVVVRGGHVMLGYWNRPEETATALRGGWMHTGDAGYMDERGYVFIVDRVKDMIVTGGENVYSAEVENALAGHAAVAACAVIGVPDDEWGERVHAVVVLAPGATATPDELREHCVARIAGYKAPRSVGFVDALPVSAAGKVLKRELRAPYWARSDRAVH